MSSEAYLLLIKRYNLFKVLACSATFFHLSLFYATFFQLLMFMLFLSSKTSSSQRILGLPNWSLRHGFPSLDLLNIIIFGHAFNMAQSVQSLFFNKHNYIIISSTNFNAQFSLFVNNMFVTLLSPTCFEH